MLVSIVVWLTYKYGCMKVLETTLKGGYTILERAS